VSISFIVNRYNKLNKSHLLGQLFNSNYMAFLWVEVGQPSEHSLPSVCLLPASAFKEM